MNRRPECGSSCRVYVLGIVLIAAGVLLGGCFGGGTRAGSRSSSEIPIRVYRVHGGGDINGDPSNYGCRLSVATIKQVVNELVDERSGVFGKNYKFTYNDVVTTIVDPNLGGLLQLREVDRINLVNLIDGIPAFQPQPGEITIYFTGAYTSGTILPTAIAFSPEFLSQSSFPPGIQPGFIMVNDGGQAQPFITRYNASTYMDSNVLQHEIGHYLGPFTTFNSLYHTHRTNTSLDNDNRREPCYGTSVLGERCFETGNYHIHNDSYLMRPFFVPSQSDPTQVTDPYPLVLLGMDYEDVSNLTQEDLDRRNTDFGPVLRGHLGGELGEVTRKIDMGLIDVVR